SCLRAGIYRRSGVRARHHVADWPARWFSGVRRSGHKTGRTRNEFSVTEMVCWATGGPQTYTGRSMSESHKHLKITESEWAAFCKDFDDTMAKFNVPEAEHKELFAIVESTKGDIVTPSSSV